MRKFLSILIVSAMTACAFASCGKIDDDESNQGTSVTEEATTSGITDEDTSSADENSDNDDIQPDSKDDTDNIQPETDNDINPVFGKWEFEDDYMVDVTVIEIKDNDNASVVVTQAMADE